MYVPRPPPEFVTVSVPGDRPFAHCQAGPRESLIPRLRSEPVTTFIIPMRTMPVPPGPRFRPPFRAAAPTP